MRAILVILILSLGIFALGCARAEVPSNRNASTRPTTGLSIPDGEITVKLKADLKARGLENVQVETVNGVVSLTGYVEDDLQKRLAEQTAMASPGVSNVRVNIEVQKRPPVNGNTKLGPRRGGI